MEEFVSVSKDFWGSYIEVIPESCCTCVSDVMYIYMQMKFKTLSIYWFIDLSSTCLSHVYTQTHLWGIIFIYLNFKSVISQRQKWEETKYFLNKLWIYKKSEFTEILQE